MNRKLLALVLAGVVSTCVSAQGVAQKVAPEETRRTRFEAFAAEDGVLKVREIFKLSPIKNKFGTAGGELVRITDVRSGDSVMALVISCEGTDRLDREVREILDEDEIMSLAAALEYIAANRAKLTKDALTYTEVTYSSRGGFLAGFYISGSETGDYMKIQTETVFLESLVDLQKVVSEAQAKMAELKKMPAK